MPFFLPRRLIEFEYFGDTEEDEEYAELARPYQRDIDLAFFVVNFGFSKAEYEDLTPREKSFIYKAWEDKVIADTQHINNAVMNAISNCNRRKGRKIVPLWKKKQKRADRDKMRSIIANIKAIEERDGKSWVEKIYAANGKLRELKRMRKNKERRRSGV